MPCSDRKLTIKVERPEFISLDLLKAVTSVVMDFTKESAHTIIMTVVLVIKCLV
jgi:hypothetical protein